MALHQILLVRSTQPENTFGRFTMELLAAEGLNGFECVDLDNEPFPALGPHDMVILTRCFLRDLEIECLYGAVERGARIVVFQPSPRLVRRFGWETRNSVIHPGWIRIAAGYPGCGVPIQTHVPVALHDRGPECGECKCVADAVHSNWSESACPAVAEQCVGQGRAVFFFYDVPEAVARIRFGNPDLASYPTLGRWKSLHAGDLFAGHVDERVKQLPQADCHCQLLAKVLTDISCYPLPRLWYYPETDHRTAAVFQSDGDNSSVDQFRQLSDSLLRHGCTATFYLMGDTRMTERDVAEFRAKGHTFAPHVNPHECQDEWYFDFRKQIREQTGSFRKRFGACSPTIQCHCAPWQGYMDWVPDFIDGGYRLLFTFVSLPVAFHNAYMCGSGRPLRFFDRGTLHDCWQQPMVTYDDLSVKERIENELSRVVAEFEKLLMSALERTHTAIPMLSHPLSFSTYSKPFIEACLDRLQREKVPVYNGDQWYAFLERRRAVRMSLEVSGEDTLRCTLHNLQGRLSLMIPVSGGARAPAVSIDGSGVSGTVHRRLEQDYMFVQLEGDAADRDIQVEVRARG